MGIQIITKIRHPNSTSLVTVHCLNDRSYGSYVLSYSSVKYSTYNSFLLGEMPQEEDANKYVTFVQELVSRDTASRADSPPADPSADIVYSTVDSLQR